MYGSNSKLNPTSPPITRPHSIQWVEETVFVDLITCLLDTQFTYQELESLSAFMDLIYSSFVKGGGLDKLCWRLDKGRDFEVCGYYLSLSLSTSTSFPWKLVWWSKIPLRVAFLLWTAALGKIFPLIIYISERYYCRRMVLYV